MPAKPAALKHESGRGSRPDPDVDFSDIPELTDEWIDSAVLVPAAPKASITIRIDPDILGWFKDTGRGYQTRINQVLRAYVAAHRAKQAAELATRAAARRGRGRKLARAK